MIYKVHYHEHSETCEKCAAATEAVDVNKVLVGDSKELIKIYNHSCEDGKNILMEFWLNYTQDE